MDCRLQLPFLVFGISCIIDKVLANSALCRRNVNVSAVGRDLGVLSFWTLDGGRAKSEPPANVLLTRGAITGMAFMTRKNVFTC